MFEHFQIYFQINSVNSWLLRNFFDFEHFTENKAPELRIIDNNYFHDRRLLSYQQHLLELITDVTASITAIITIRQCCGSTHETNSPRLNANTFPFFMHFLISIHPIWSKYRLSTVRLTLLLYTGKKFLTQKKLH